MQGYAPSLAATVGILGLREPVRKHQKTNGTIWKETVLLNSETAVNHKMRIVPHIAAWETYVTQTGGNPRASYTIGCITV
eukprot:794656-Amphidinium_carterae.1